MKVVDTSSKQALFTQIKSSIQAKLSAKDAKSVADFVDQFFVSIFIDEFEGRRISDVLGLIMSAWKFVQNFDGKKAKVEVFNPNLEEYSWQSPHTVLMVLQRNMPFIVDSVRMSLISSEVKTHSIQYTTLSCNRDKSGSLKKINANKEDSNSTSDDFEREAIVFIEVTKHSELADQKVLQERIEGVLNDIESAVNDFDKMVSHCKSIVTELDSAKIKGISELEKNEGITFLEWLMNEHFTFLGYVDYQIDKTGLKPVKKSALGVLHAHPEQILEIDFANVQTKTRQYILGKTLFSFSKHATRSNVHRPIYPDEIHIKKFDAKGNVIGESCFVGLFTAKTFNERPEKIPVIRKKIQHVIQKSELNVNDHRGKELLQLLAVYPREELFHVSRDELFDTVIGTLYVQSRAKPCLFMHADPYGNFVSCHVYIPREIFNTDVRMKIQSFLMAELNGQDIEYSTFISESVLARSLMNIRINPEDDGHFDVKKLEEKITVIASLWEDDFENALLDAYGEERAGRYSNQYSNAFSSSYREDFSPRRAAIDVEHVEKVGKGQLLDMSFYRSLNEDEKIIHFKLFHADQPIPLSDVMPIFEHMGFRVIGEKPYETVDNNGRTVWMHDFMLTTRTNQIIDIQKIRDAFEVLFTKVWMGEAENDSFNRLVTTAYMDWRKIAMLRSYSRYMRQIRVSNSQEFISNTIVKNIEISSLLVQFFDQRFNPQLNKSKGKSEASMAELTDQFNLLLDQVQNLSEDKILRLYLELIKATMRTNYYQTEENGAYKNYISLKFHPRLIPDVPLPVPMFEIFVYSPRIEGVHLRGGKVARGGLRWSDRYEDYRTEVLGLVKAQQVKNAVIVPVGAKGGFVAKKLPQSGDREAFMKEGITCYKQFITGLLNITDNLVDGSVVKPRQVVCHDEDDYYLVVAADKGTATFSDIANEISLEKGHWLGDAFASGGSQGYDHKKMGITAKGAWVSVQRHFREMGTNIQETPFTVIGIGDMAGDVFGNGMILSPCTKLVAAFNHMHIFFDPDPDPKKSFAERQRLFNLPRSTWSDYNAKLISKGGGLFSRNVKSIDLTKEMQTFLACNDKKMPPNQLINAILKAQADLLWIGGIGTYVMSESETHAEVGDKANDTLRITGSELKVKVIGEGGNLGMTQLSRIEYAKKGGRLNTDFIDNAAGVDCSDHEVNIKILLNDIQHAGDLTEKQRNKLLTEMTSSVAEHVLKNNYRQTQAISIAHSESLSRTEEYRRLMNSMEAAGKLNRSLEFLPNDEQIIERKTLDEGLTRPELSVLISYVKGDLKEELNNSDLPDRANLASEIDDIFPKQITKNFHQALHSHRLRREIISTQVANDMVNHMGISFVDRLKQSTGATSSSIAIAYIIARDVFDLEHWWKAIEALDYKVSSDLQWRMMSELMSLVRRACRWLIRNRRSELNVTEHMERFKKGIAQISKSLPDYLTGSSKEDWSNKYDMLIEQGVPKDLAATVAGSRQLYAALGIIEAQESSEGSLNMVANVYYVLGNRLELIWFGQQINNLTPLTHWQALAREAFREDLDWQQRALTVGLLQLKDAPKDIEKRVDYWMTQHEDLVTRWKHTLTEFKAAEDAEFSMYSVALRELLDLAQSTTHAAC